LVPQAGTPRSSDRRRDLDGPPPKAVIWSCQDVCWSPHDIPDSARVGHSAASDDDPRVVLDPDRLRPVGGRVHSVHDGATLAARTICVDTTLTAVTRARCDSATGLAGSPASVASPRAAVDRQVCRRHRGAPLATRPRRCSASAARPEKGQLPAYRALGASAAGRRSDHPATVIKPPPNSSA